MKPRHGHGPTNLKPSYSYKEKVQTSAHGKGKQKAFALAIQKLNSVESFDGRIWQNGIHQKAHPTWHVSCWLDSEWSALIENPIKGSQKSDPKQGNPIGCPKSLSLCSMAPWKKPKPNTSIFEEYSLAHFKRRSLEVLTSAFFPAFKSFVPTLMKVMWSLVLSQLIVWRVVHPF